MLEFYYSHTCMTVTTDRGVPVCLLRTPAAAWLRPSVFFFLEWPSDSASAVPQATTPLCRCQLAPSTLDFGPPVIGNRWGPTRPVVHQSSYTVHLLKKQKTKTQCICLMGKTKILHISTCIRKPTGYTHHYILVFIHVCTATFSYCIVRLVRRDFFLVA